MPLCNKWKRKKGRRRKKRQEKNIGGKNENREHAKELRNKQTINGKAEDKRKYKERAQREKEQVKERARKEKEGKKERKNEHRKRGKKRKQGLSRSGTRDVYSEMRLILKMMLTLYALLANVTMYEQQSGCVVVFAEGGGTVYMQASTTSLLPRRNMLSPVVTALINFLHDFILFILFLHSYSYLTVVPRRIMFSFHLHITALNTFCSIVLWAFLVVLLHSSGL